MDAIESRVSEDAAPTANPYTDPAQAAIYAAISPEDQAWATKGGGRPDLTDPYIAARAPNKFKPAADSGPLTRGLNQAANPAPVSGAATTQAQADAARNASEPAEPAQAANPAPATPAAPVNRDAMPFGKAFADARAKGEKQFAWKGKKYAVQMAAPKQAANPAKTAPLPGRAAPVGGATDTMGASDPMTGMPYSPMAENVGHGKLAKSLIESFGYTTK